MEYVSKNVYINTILHIYKKRRYHLQMDNLIII